MAAYVAFAQEDDYYTSTKFLGLFTTFESTLNYVNDKFENINEQPNDLTDWVDWVYCDKQISNTNQFGHSKSYVGCIKNNGMFVPNKWNIVIVEIKETE